MIVGGCVSLLRAQVWLPCSKGFWRMNCVGLDLAALFKRLLAHELCVSRFGCLVQKALNA